MPRNQSGFKLSCFSMEDKPDVVHFQMDQPKLRQSEVTKALQIKLSNEKTVIVYNRVNSYILDALLKAVF